MNRCGLTEVKEGCYVDGLSADAYVWYEEDWQHEANEHVHRRYQLTYVEEGYQYFHIGKKIYLAPQNHVIWIPSGEPHRTSTEAKTVNLMLILFQSVPDHDFFKQVHLFPAPKVLKEMLLYASKWNKRLYDEEEKDIFLQAMLTSLPSFCNENNALQIPIPTDSRLIPVCNTININYPYHLDMENLADVAKMSVRNLQRTFKQETGITIQKYMQLIRILKSIAYLDTNQYTLSEIAFKVGYKSLSAFTASYFAIMKTKPRLKKNLS